VNPRVPEALDRLVMKALARDPDERFQDAGEMHRALERVLRERQPVTAAELARFMEVLFDRHEREEAVLEERREDGAPPGSGAEGGDALSPGAMSVDTLLKRFGIE
jgi:serine/threonine-protein kinase